MANLQQLKRSIGKHYRIQPCLLEFSDAAVDRGFLDDAWLLTAVTDDTLTLRHRDLGLDITLGLDSYVNFSKDPDRDAKLQVEGVLVLRSQVYKFAGALGSVFTKEPGRQHRDFRPPATKPTLLDAARAAGARKDLEHRQAQFLMGGQSLRDALSSFNAIPAMVDAHVAALKMEKIIVDVHKLRDTFHEPFWFRHAIWCNGWWFTLRLEHAGNVESLELKIVQWRDRPDWPRFARYGDEEPLKRWVRHYRLTESGPRWIGGSLEPHTEGALAEWLLMVALEKPGRMSIPP
jgi:hypothetical protein